MEICEFRVVICQLLPVDLVSRIRCRAIIWKNWLVLRSEDELLVNPKSQIARNTPRESLKRVLKVWSGIHVRIWREEAAILLLAPPLSRDQDHVSEISPPEIQYGCPNQEVDIRENILRIFSQLLEPNCCSHMLTRYSMFVHTRDQVLMFALN